MLIACIAEFSGEVEEVGRHFGGRGSADSPQKRVLGRLKSNHEMKISDLMMLIYKNPCFPVNLVSLSSNPTYTTLNCIC
jgi:hypothetical protein